MKRNTFILFVFSCLLIVVSCSVSSCYYDVEEELYGFCDSTNVTYSTTIANIVNSYGCTGCHTGPGPSGGFRLDSYAGIKAKVDDGRLAGAINHLQGFSPMP